MIWMGSQNIYPISRCSFALIDNSQVSLDKIIEITDYNYWIGVSTKFPHKQMNKFQEMRILHELTHFMFNYFIVNCFQFVCKECQKLVWTHQSPSVSPGTTAWQKNWQQLYHMSNSGMWKIIASHNKSKIHTIILLHNSSQLTYF